MALTKEQRDALPESDFAVPETRQLPMHDAKHTKLAWDMVDNTKGLSNEQRKAARDSILSRAHDLGVNTENWNQLKAMRFEGMAVEMPEVKDHPNRIPFSGVLTRIDEPSDNPLGGSHGKRVTLPKAVAEKALSSLLGMAVDFTPELDGHDAQNKIGLITEANIIGNAIHISGFFYGADFPTEVKNIQANKASLGFSYEAQARVKSLSDDPLVVESCVFTGAAVLYKDCAAYTTTSLTASKAETEKKMNEELMKLLASIQARLDGIEASQKEQKDAQLNAASIGHIIKPHADRLRANADELERAGIGMHASRGHVAVLRSMADVMEAEAAMGRTPHTFQSGDYMYAKADKSKEDEGDADKEDNKEMSELKASLAVITTKLTDMEGARFQAAAAPDRKTLDPAVLALLAKAGVTPSANEKMTVAQLDKALDSSGITRQQSIAVKLAMQGTGMLTNS